MLRVLKDSFYNKVAEKDKQLQPEAPSGRELAAAMFESKLATERSGVCRLTEGECVTIKPSETQSYAGSFRHAPQRTPKAHFIRFGEPLPRATVSLRLGHARALTPHRGVIHYPRAASLPLGGRLI